jgi:hypothetical protein
MSTTADFNSMLNEYLSIDLMKEELIKRDYLLQKVDRNDGWKSGTIPVPFEGQHASSFSFGALSADTNISKYKYVRGQVTTFRELWGAMRFESRDLMQHDGKVNEKSFLKILPGQIDDFVSGMKMTASINLMDGPSFAVLTVDGTAGGVIEVDRVDRFTIDQELFLDDNDSVPLQVFVIAIDVNAGTLGRGTVTLSASRGGVAVSVAAYTVAQGAKAYHPGAQTESFTSLASQLLSAANGGSATIFGQTKTAYPYLQAIQYSGATMSATNVLDIIFAAYSKRQQLAKSGKLPEVLVSYKHMGSILTKIQTNTAAFNIVPESRKISQFGWQEVMIGSVSGELLKIVALQEKSDDNIMMLDWDSITLYTNGFLQRQTSPEGLQYFTIRATSGFSYILDHCLMGDIVCKAPWKNLIIHSIPNY